VSNPDRLPVSVTHEVRDTCMCLHVQRAARALARRYDDALRPFGLTSGQFSLLMSLNRPEPPSIGQVSSVLAMDRTTLNANLKPLARRRLLTVSVDKNDRRSRRLALTPAGRALLITALPVWRKTHTALESLLGGSADTVRAALHKLSQAPLTSPLRREGEASVRTVAARRPARRERARLGPAAARQRD
jgi:DNA-binding MarR family transcriptional regulator